MTTRAILLARSILILGCALLASVQAQAAQHFTLRINDRPGMFPAGEVKLTFELNANLVGGESLTVAGDTLTLGPPGALNSTATLTNGDRVRAFTFGSDPRRVTLRYTPKSILATAAGAIDYCNLVSGTTFPRDIAITWNSTSVTVGGYRMNTYTVASTTDCSQARRRVQSNAAVLAAIPPGVVNKGRHELDVILVLDKSGSMRLPLPGSAAGEIRFDRLKTAVQQFVALWEQADMTSPPGTMTPDLQGDRLGLVFFDGVAVPELFGADIFKGRGTAAPGPGHNWQEVINRVNSKSWGGSTTIAGGVIEGYKHWCDDGSIKNDATLVVVTDGFQEAAPYFTASNPRAFDGYRVWPYIEPSDPNAVKSCLDESTATAADFTKLYSMGVPMLTVGLGTYNSVDAQMLDDIGTQTAGRSTIAADAPTFDSAITDSLVEALKGNSLSLQTRSRATIAASASASAPLSASFDRSIRRAVFVVGWEGAQNSNALNLEIRRPNGSVATPLATQSGSLWAVQSIDIPTSGPSGQWQLIVKRKTAGTTPINYQASVYVVEGKLDWRFRIPDLYLATGRPLRLEAELAYGGKPAVKLPPGAVRVFVESPQEGLGNILRSTQVRIESRPLVRGKEDILSPYGEKIAQLEKSERLQERIAPRPAREPLELAELKNGKYGASLGEITKPGLHRFKIVLNWKSPEGERIQRVEYLERQIPILPSPESEVVVKRGPKRGEYSVIVTPRDTFGNFAGPGQESAFAVGMAGRGKMPFPIEDPQLNGSYVIRLSGVSAGADPKVKIAFAGTILRDAPLSRLEKPLEGRIGVPVPREVPLPGLERPAPSKN